MTYAAIPRQFWPESSTAALPASKYADRRFCGSFVQTPALPIFGFASERMPRRWRACVHPYDSWKHRIAILHRRYCGNDDPLILMESNLTAPTSIPVLILWAWLRFQYPSDEVVTFPRASAAGGCIISLKMKSIHLSLWCRSRSPASHPKSTSVEPLITLVTEAARHRLFPGCGNC